MQAQNYPQDYFRCPLDSLPNFVSPFGGLRDNHFHSGVDLKTNQHEGLPVYATADGYVARIKIQSGGYGKALYIDHPNGFTTVYGHLQKYHGEIAKWIYKQQYKELSFEFDKVFDHAVLFVKKGDTIGFSGNSGGSTGPHLHYEIRDSKSEKILNPLLFGMGLKDSLRPVIFNVFFYKFVTEGLLLKKRLNIQPKNLTANDSLFIYKDTLVLEEDMYGAGIEAYDYIHNAKDAKGIYEYQLWLDGKLCFQHQLSRFSFDESKYINVHIDYPYYRLEKVRIQKCFIDDGNELNTYKTNAINGRLLLNKRKTGCIELIVVDFNKNSYKLQIPYKTEPKKIDDERVKYYKLVRGKKAFYPLKDNSINRKQFVLKMNAGSLYDTLFYNLTENAPLKYSLSKVYTLNQSITPVKKAFEIGIKPTDAKNRHRDKMLLAYFDKTESNFRSAGGAFENGFVWAKVSAFGSYFVYIDSIAPLIKQVFIKPDYDLSDTLKWNFEIKDNFSGIARYEAYIDCRWILMDYDAKNNLLIYHYDEVYQSILLDIETRKINNFSEIRPELILLVTDKKGNVSTKSFWPLTNK
ncbi:MAG: M23 family metallopeptidase [Bacteroidia bacterium]|nr:M23 family metallopeptidase [Bacteroidia bacterium]